MNEKLQYADMLELPANSCTVTFKPKRRLFKKKNRKKADDVKQQVLDKVNLSENVNEQDDSYENADSENYNQGPAVSDQASPSKKSKPRFSGVTFALIIMGALIAVILLTNAFYPTSGINVFMNNVFGKTGEQPVITDARTYQDFSPVITFNGATSELENGVLDFQGEGSIYSVCDGKVASIVQDEAGKFTVEIAHSDNFVSVFTGLDYAYVAEGQTVYSNIPVGYINETVALCFKNGETVITDFEVMEDNVVVWGE